MTTCKFKKTIYLLAAAAGMTLAACSADEPAAPSDKQPEIVTPRLQFGVLDLKEADGSRAATPMDEHEERYVRTLALFEFDNEGMHISGPDTYHFIDFIKGTIDGVAGTTGDITDGASQDGVIDALITGLTFESHTNGMICAVANVTEDEVDDMYMKLREPGQTKGRLLITNFKKWTLPFEYKGGNPDYDYEEAVSGHLKNMYMFGYWEGNIAKDDETLHIDLGRLASRLDITIINQTGMDITRRFGYHFDNVCKSAYVFPTKESVPPQEGAGNTRTIICSGYKDDNPTEIDIVEGADPALDIPVTFPNGASHTRYFYTAAHSADSLSHATKLHLFWNARIVDEIMSTNPNGRHTYVPICNLQPGVADDVKNGYTLSRNTRYHITLRMRRNAVGGRSSSMQAVAPGDYIIYLPVGDE